jgi:glycosyltransferase involved in cell wall biosynthesis
LIFKIKKKNIKCYNFHIAYPLLTYSRIFTWFIKKPIFVTEHWSAYHFNFGMNKKLKRIQHIFKNKKLKLICVSNALANDIKNYSETNLDINILYNVVDEKVFKYENGLKTSNSFFLVSYWKSPKNPFIIIKACHQLKENLNLKFSLRIAGEGPLIDKMKKMVKDCNLEDYVVFLGTMSSKEIANEMNSSTYFIHNSNYETFSVVCAEALMCGTPVIASNVGAIPEYLTTDMGVLVDDNTIENWEKILLNALNNNYVFDNEKIAMSAKKYFSKEIIGQKYNAILNGEN